MKRLVIRGGRLIDPASGLDGLYNIYVAEGRIADIREASSDDSSLEGVDDGLEVIDASGLLVVPGFVDIHSHFREPGFEYKETIATGALAAAAGGYTTVLCMANTMPVNDNQSVTRYIIRKAFEAGLVKVLPVGAVSPGLEGRELTEMAELKEAGCVAFSDDGITVADPLLMRRALEYSGPLGLAIITHSEDPSLSCGSMNEGAVSTRLGLSGIPDASEVVIVARDITLAELTGGRLHVAHVSTAGAVELIRNARRKGIKVTAEVTPHHLVFTDEDLKGYDTNFKMSPPLRSAEDVAAVREGLNDGTIDCVATDHAPHSTIEKDIEWNKAANGVVGLETAFSSLYGLVGEGVFTLSEIVSFLTDRPARVMGLDAGVLVKGAPADITLIDLNESWTVTSTAIRSRSKNSPFIGADIKGSVKSTIVEGRVIYKREGS